MQFLTKISLKRPVSTMLALLALFVFGSASIFTFEMELYPRVTAPILGVYVSYEGADAETVDKLVTQPIEEFGSKMQGVYATESTTGTGFSQILFTCDYDIDMDKLLMDFKSELDRVSLPEGCDKPSAMVAKMSNSFMSVQVNATNEADPMLYVTNTVKPRLERLTGVAEVKVYGGDEEYISILLNERLMEQYSVTTDAIRQAILDTEYSIPADAMRQGSIDIRVSSTSKVSSIGEIEEIPVQTGSGSIITLRDIADISYAIKRSGSISRHNGIEDIRIEITKNQNASTVTAARKVASELNRLDMENSSVSLVITENSADDIVKSLKDVGMTLIIGILLSMLTLFLFFGDIKASLIVGSSMPISLLATLIIMAFAKLQLNIMTLGGLVISIGMMVDSSIVVLESCFRSQEKGLDFKESALHGTGEVTASIVASTITTVVVYAPIAVVGGIYSSMFQGLCLTIIFAMLTSLLVSLTFIPLFFWFYKPVEKKNAPAIHIMEKLSARYAKAVRKIIPRKFAVVTLTVVLVGLAALMVSNMNFELEESVDQGRFKVSVDTRKGTALEVADEIAKKYEEILLNDPDIRDVDYYAGNNVASITAYIKKELKLPTSKKVEEYNRLWAGETGADIKVEEITDSPSGNSSGTSVTLTGEDYAILKKNVYEAMEALSSIEGVFHVSSQLSEGAPEAKIYINPKKAMDAGLNPKSVGSLIASINGGINTLKLKNAGEEYNVKIEYPKDQYDDLYKLMNLKLTGQNGRIVPLSDIAELKFEEASDEIMKRNGMYSLSITMLTSEDDKFRVQDEAQDVIKKMNRGGMTLGKDAIAEMEETEMRKMLMAILSSIFLVFLVMAMQFESPRFSTMVMMSIPFSFIGSIGLLFASGSSITMSAALGVLMLVGIVVNDGILFVDTTNSMKKHYPINEALARAGELRLRPILMTTLTTVLSMIPLVVSPDSGAELMDGMGLIIIGGLSASTLLILFLLPTYYTMIMGKRAKLENLKMFPPEGQAVEDKKSKKHKKKHHKKHKKKHHNEEAASDEIPSVDDLTDEKPAEEEPAEEKPSEEKPEGEEGSDEKPADEKPASESETEPEESTADDKDN